MGPQPQTGSMEIGRAGKRAAHNGAIKMELFPFFWGGGGGERERGVTQINLTSIRFSHENDHGSARASTRTYTQRYPSTTKILSGSWRT